MKFRSPRRQEGPLTMKRRKKLIKNSVCLDLNQGISMFNAFSSNIVLFEDKLSFQWLGKRKKVSFGIQQTPNGNTIS